MPWVESNKVSGQWERVGSPDTYHEEISTEGIEEVTTEGIEASTKSNTPRHTRWLFSTRENSDCLLIVGPDKILIETRSIIVLRLPVFQAPHDSPRRMQDETRTADERLLTCSWGLPDENPEDIEWLLRYLYLGEYDGSDDNESCPFSESTAKYLKPYQDLDRHVRMHALAYTFKLPMLSNLAFSAISTLRANHCFWGSPFLKIVKSAYARTTPGHMDVRNLLVKMAVDSLLSKQYCITIFGQMLAMPGFGVDLGKAIVDECAGYRGRPKVFNTKAEIESHEEAEKNNDDDDDDDDDGFEVGNGVNYEDDAENDGGTEDEQVQRQDEVENDGDEDDNVQPQDNIENSWEDEDWEM